MLPIAPALSQKEIVELDLLPHADARKLAATGAPVYVLVNPVEFHGPHLSLYNDHLLAYAATCDLHARLRVRHPEWPLVMSTPIHLGCDAVPRHGSRFTSYRDVRRAVLAACDGLIELGVKRVVFMTFHGGPLHAMALKAGVERLERHGVQALAPFNLVIRELLDYSPEKFAEALLPISDRATRDLIASNLDLDFHAGFFETSLVLHYAPSTVAPSYGQLPPCATITPKRGVKLLSDLAARLGFRHLAAELRFAAYGMGWLRVDPFTGYTGWPHLANAESGRFFAELIMQRYVAATEAVFFAHGRSPEPIMKWLLPLSLGGRMPPPA